mmetsp:Transcript_24676/g.36356  ORF Transcript_24676/g.36356 Transcript_24676/m.36356 type:complete len:299 (+) Transcript_24676:47-943(+)
MPSGCPSESSSPSEGCPVDHDSSSVSRSSSVFSLLFGSTQPSPLSPAAPDTPSTPSQTAETSKHNTLANDLVFGDNVHPDQRIPLSKTRSISNIPKGEYTPEHQPHGSKPLDRWVYPSQQQYYNAMKRKGYNPQEEDVAVILAIHNMVNEKGWQEIIEWERLRGCSNPRLKRFMGKAKDISPKAYLKALMGYTLPFDRHDWLIDSNGEEVRYVIDFYTGSAAPSAQISMHLDVRPALDTPTAFFVRAQRAAMELVDASPFAQDIYKMVDRISGGKCNLASPEKVDTNPTSGTENDGPK